MVGHSGDIPATVKGLEVIDRCLEQILKRVNLEDTTVIVTADHGNCDEMLVNDQR